MKKRKAQIARPDVGQDVMDETRRLFQSLSPSEQKDPMAGGRCFNAAVESRARMLARQAGGEE